MEKIISTKLVIQILIFIAMAVFFLLMAEFSISLMHGKRIGKYSVDPNVTRYSFVENIINIINKIKDLLNKFLLKIFKKYDTNHQRYASVHNTFIKQGIDVLSMQLLCFIISIILSIIFNLYNQTKLTIINIFVFPIIISVVIKIFIYLKYRKKIANVKEGFYDAIEIINITLKSKDSLIKGIKNVIEKLDGSIKFEFEMVLNDLNYGLSYQNAFQRLYNRNKISEIKYFISVLKTYGQVGENVTKLFDQVEKELLLQLNVKNEYKVKMTFYKVILGILYAVPLIYVVIKYLILNTTIDLPSNPGTYLLIGTIIIFYILFILVTLLIVMGDNLYDKK